MDKESQNIKKVVIVGPAHPLRGGLATFNQRLAVEYLKFGFEVEIVSFKLQYPGIFFPGKSQFTDEPAPGNIKILSWINSINPFNWYWVGKKMKEFSPDMLIIRYWIPFMAPSLGVISMITRKNGKTKVIAIADNIIPHEKRLFDKTLSNFFIKSVDGIVTMSKAVLEDLDIFDKKKPRKLLSHPLYDNFGESISKNEAMNHLGLSEKYGYVLFFGFIRDYKGLDLLLEAFGDERIKELPIKLIVAGEFYTKPEPFYEIIKKHQIAEKVILSNDFITDSEVRYYFCAADLVVQPYKDATQSGVTQVAYHFNKPMIVTNVGGLAEIIPNNRVGYVVEPESKNIADSIVRFYSGNMENVFSENASIEKLKYSWETYVLNINELLKEIQKK